MQLNLNNVSVPTIMRMGTWKSAAVMEYVRSNIDNLSKNVDKYIANASTGQFCTLPSYIATINDSD